MNKTILMGRLTKDIEVRYSASQVAYGSFNLAVNRRFSKEGEEKQADFISCKVFGKTCENMAKFFSKGSLALIEGRIQTGSYDKEGTKIYTTDVIVENFNFTGEKKGDATTTNTSAIPGTEIEDDNDLPF